jgi:hypothetical protein
MTELDEQGRPEPPPAADENDTLLGFLEYKRATLAWKSARPGWHAGPAFLAFPVATGLQLSPDSQAIEHRFRNMARVFCP